MTDLLDRETYDPNGPTGPALAAWVFLIHLAEGRFEDAWHFADQEWRLGRVQRWLWAYQSLPGLGPLDDEAAAGTDHSPERPWWPVFAEAERRGWATFLAGFDISTWGQSTDPLPAGLDYEQVIFVRTADLGAPHSTPLVTHVDTAGQRWIRNSQGDGAAATPIPPAVEVLMHLVDGRWLIAAVNTPRYQPGWPPTFIDGTPMA